MLNVLNSPRGMRILAGLIALTQALDIVIHAATNQLEWIRVTSNVVILVWLALVVTQRLTIASHRAGFAFMGLYLALNLIFLATQGTSNPQNGQPRTALFVLVIATLLLSSVLTIVHRPKR